jgi:hypothetical protein
MHHDKINCHDNSLKSKIFTGSDDSTIIVWQIKTLPNVNWLKLRVDASDDAIEAHISQIVST